MLSVDMIPSGSTMFLMLERFAIDLRSFREPLRRSVREVVIPSINQNFELGGRPPWTPLEDATVEQRSYYGFDDTPLVKTGDLRTAAQAEARWTYTQETAEYGDFPASVAYGAAHQDGASGSGKARTTNIPPRPFVDVQPEDMDAIEARFIEWIRERALAAGFFPGGD